jgi:hypothetical protein
MLMLEHLTETEDNVISKLRKAVPKMNAERTKSSAKSGRHAREALTSCLRAEDLEDAYASTTDDGHIGQSMDQQEFDCSWRCWEGRSFIEARNGIVAADLPAMGTM